MIETIKATRMNNAKNKKNCLIIPALMVMIIAVCLTACGKKVENPYGATVAALGDDDAYAFLVMDYKYNVLVSSDMLYDSGTERQAAVYCDVYYYTGGEAKNLGTVMSDGTAYPISFSKNGIYAASGHSVEKYGISEKNGALYLEKGVYVNYDENGTEHYTCIQGGEETDSTEKDFMEMTEEYASGQIIHFAYGAADCLNEMRW